MILIWDHDKREAPSMTPSNDTIDYFSSINIPCVAAQRNAVEGMKNSENHYRHNQRLTVMDEPIICTNQVVYLDDDINLIFLILVIIINWYLIYSRNILFQQERNPFSAKQSKMVSYIGVEFENNRNESFFDCRGYNCGISQFKGHPSTDIKRTFEERWLRLSNNKDVIMPDLYLSRWV